MLTAWLALSMGGIGLYILLRIQREGSVRVQEPNTAILYFEIVAYGGLLLFGILFVMWLAVQAGTAKRQEQAKGGK